MSSDSHFLLDEVARKSPSSVLRMVSPTKPSGKAVKKAGKAQKSVLNKSGEKVTSQLLCYYQFTVRTKNVQFTLVG